MSFQELFSTGKCVLSFELFPPKRDSGVAELMKTVEELDVHQPDFLTCTYGAGGSTRDRTLTIAANVRRNLGRPVASHLTCVGSTRDELRAYLSEAQAAGVDYIVALRGDPPKGETTFKPVDGGLSYAVDLVKLIKEEFPHFGIAVAGYPEVHQEATDAQSDLDNLVRKVDAGADLVITQLFYDNDDFFRFRDRCEQAGIQVPIVPGLLPVLSLPQVQRITSLCKAKLPSMLLERLQAKDDADWQFNVGVEHAREQTHGLLDAGVAGIHFYVLNRSTAMALVLDRLKGMENAHAM